jgi:hypothetical protein
LLHITLDGAKPNKISFSVFEVYITLDGAGSSYWKLLNCVADCHNYRVLENEI